MIPQPNLLVQLLSIRWVSSCRSPWYFRIDILVTAASSRLNLDADHVEMICAMRVLTDRYVTVLLRVGARLKRWYGWTTATFGLHRDSA
jgi:hypothetical protein